jgi:hypothetical protein
VSDLEARLSAVEARLEIGQLPIRYALAVDGRDVDAWLNLFVPDVNCGAAGVGHAVLRDVISPQLRWFRRSIHQICGHRIELMAADRARGEVYCRAEHEVDDRWIVMAICYFDSYRKVEGEWLFERRRERHWYAVDQLERPQDVAFGSWEHAPAPALPDAFPTWADFWKAS